MDHRHLPNGIDAAVSRRGMMQLLVACGASMQSGSSRHFGSFAQARENRLTVFLGDSQLEFGQIPFIYSDATGERVVNGGIGGTRLSTTYDSEGASFYAPLSVASVANCIYSGNFQPLREAARSVLTHTRDDDNSEIVERLASIDKGRISRFIIFAGTNDYGGNAPLGRNDDSTPATVRGAISTIARMLRSAHEAADVIFVTPVWRGRLQRGDGKNADVYPNDSGVFLRVYVSAIMEQARRTGSPALDLYTSSGISKETAAEAIPDGVHLSRRHGNLVAQKIAAFTKALAVNRHQAG